MNAERLPNERKFNEELARILTRLELPSKGEEPVGTNEEIDCLSDWKGRKIAVEAKKGYSKTARDGALVQAAERIANGYAQGGVAVCYPKGLTPSVMDEDSRLWVSEIGGGWAETTISGLASVIRRVSDDLGDIDLAAKTFKKKLMSAAGILGDHQVRDIAAAAHIPLDEKRGKKKDREKAVPRAALRAALLVASAALFHSRLDAAVASEEVTRPDKDARTGERYTGPWPFKRLGKCIGIEGEAIDPDVIGNLREAWNIILAVDYKPVFETALAVLAAPVPDRNFTEFLRSCGGAASAAAGSLTRGQTDLLGRVFHRVLDEAENTGAFYTSSSAATILAGMAIREGDVDGDLDYSVVDPACGTGTLLAAAAERIQEVSGQYKKPGGKKLIEEVLHGYDIDITATHMAAVTLGLMAPSVGFREMNIHRFPLGWAEDEDGGRTTSIGSLELMDEGRLARDAGWPQSPRAHQVDTPQREEVRPVRRDLVIMNPPYTGQQKRHHHLAAGEKDDVKAREREVFKMLPVPRSGSSGMFLFLADRLCKEGEGTIASVVPTSWFGGTEKRQDVWAHLLKNYHLETVVTSHDPGRIWFSQNTNSNESLIVLRRLDDDNRNLPTRFVNLAVNPKTAADAVPIVADIRSGKTKGIEWPRKKVEAGDWTPVRFSSRRLVDTAIRWFKNGELGLGATIGKLAETGPGRVAVCVMTHTQETSPDRLGRRALWNNNQNIPARGTAAPPKKTLRLEPDCYIHPKQGKESASDRLWALRGRLFIPELFHTTGLRLCAAVTDEPVLGGKWIPVKPRDPVPGWEEAMCVYLNSTVGMFAVLYFAKTNKLTYPNMAVELLHGLPAPDLTEDAVGFLAAAYRRWRDEPLLHLGDEKDDDVRQALDATVCEVFGWDLEEVASIRRALSKEPRIAGRRAG